MLYAAHRAVTEHNIDGVHGADGKKRYGDGWDGCKGCGNGQEWD